MDIYPSMYQHGNSETKEKKTVDGLIIFHIFIYAKRIYRFQASLKDKNSMLYRKKFKGSKKAT